MNRAVIVFLKPIVPGRVKTRLAKDVGETKACHIYQKLITHTADSIRSLNADVYLFYDEFADDTQALFLNPMQICLQQGEDLGARMMHAFQYVFSLAYEQVLIIGTDCPLLTAEILEQAFEFLNQTQAVIGPATDGGYYLLGLTQCIEALFKDISWSTDTVLRQTLQKLNDETIPFRLLPELSDADTLADLLILPDPIRKHYDIGTN